MLLWNPVQIDEQTRALMDAAAHLKRLGYRELAELLERIADRRARG